MMYVIIGIILALIVSVSAYFLYFKKNNIKGTYRVIDSAGRKMFFIITDETIQPFTNAPGRIVYTYKDSGNKNENSTIYTIENDSSGTFYVNESKLYIKFRPTEDTIILTKISDKNLTREEALNFP